MIEINDKHKCCGCAACVQSCPKQCISFVMDYEGFSYPLVDKDRCIDCHLCERVCPCLNQNNQVLPLLVTVAYNHQADVRYKSSSGGLFAIFAEKIIMEGGIVFGARFDKNWNVVHDYTESLDGLNVFLGSKYVQSSIGESYKQVKCFLKNDRKVLFSGTPCQIAGLKKFLRKEYEKLFTVEVVCHGVPSPIVWKSYLDYVNPQHKIITNINFRDKSRGWKKYSYLINTSGKTIVDDYASSSLYLKGFSLNLTLRPSCYKCPTKEMKSSADITLGDCWGVENIRDIKDDDKGLSVVVINTHRGENMFNELAVSCHTVNFDFVKKYNPSIYYQTKEPYCRDVFWQNFHKYGIIAVDMVIRKLNNPIYRLINKIRTKIRK